MAQAVVKFKTSELINTFSCADTNNLILCVNSDKVLQPDGFVGTKTYIVATLLSGPDRCTRPTLPDCCDSPCPRYYVYEFVFDDDQLNPGEILNQCDIYNVIYDQCLIAWAEELIAQAPPYLPLAPTGRITLETGVPVPQSDITPATTIYYTAYSGGTVWLYTNEVWRPYAFSNISLALGTLVSNKNYDVFIYDNAGTVVLELSAAWANDTTRTDALALQDGFYVKSGSTNKLHLGTIRTISTTETEDRLTNRYVWNRYNQVARPIRKLITDVSWTYGTTTWRPSNNDAVNNRVSAVVGDLNSSISLKFLQKTDLPNTPTSTAISIGIDSITTNSNKCAISPNVNPFASGATTTVPGMVIFDDYIPLGYHFWQMLEIALLGTGTFYGNNESGFSGHIIM